MRSDMAQTDRRTDRQTDRQTDRDGVQLEVGLVFGVGSHKISYIISTVGLHNIFQLYFTTLLLRELFMRIIKVKCLATHCYLSLSSSLLFAV